MPQENGASATSSKAGGLMGSGTVGGLMAFFDYLITKGIATAAAVTPLKSAARQVFETVEGTEAIDEIEVRSLDVDEYLERFQVKAIGTGRYKPESISAYRSRFARGMEYYSAFLTTGTVPKFKLRGAAVASSVRKRPPAVQRKPESSSTPPTQATSEPPDAQGSTSGLISYPFPLQSGAIATVRLPVRLERTDAERLAAFIRTLVFEPQKELTRGSNEQPPETKRP